VNPGDFRLSQPPMDDPPTAPPKPTQTPSWVMLGFVVGVLFMVALPRREPAAAPPAAPVPAPAAPSLAPPPRTIDAVFATWGKYAKWENDTAEVALWNSGTKDYSDCYEVLRLGDAYFFRQIPRLTRPILRHDVPEAQNAPLQFTETAAQQQEWRKEANDENWRAFSDALHSGAAKPKDAP
jgi:hypothetical protein